MIIMKGIKLITLLISDNKGNISHTKLWSNISNVVATGIIIYITYLGKIDVEYFAAYMMVLSGHAIASKYIEKDSSDAHTTTT